jgi:hypothetical protein
MACPWERVTLRSPTYWDTAVACSPTSLCLTCEQRVGDPIGDDFVVAILMSWCPKIEVIAGSPTPERKEPLGRFSSSPAKKSSKFAVKKLLTVTEIPSGKTNRPMVSEDRWGSKSWATRRPTARGSALSPVAIPLCHCSSTEEIAVTSTE